MIKYFSHFILVVTFFVCNAFAWAETNVAEKYGCKNLHEIQSGEDALQQLYDNLNTDCFAKIPEIELEKIWGIKVYDFGNPNGITKNMSDEEVRQWSDRDVKGKMAKELKANFERDSDKNIRKSIKINKITAYYNDRFNLIDYNNKFPKKLPNPFIECKNDKKLNVYIVGYGFYKMTNYGVYSPLCNYFWKGKKNKLEIKIEYPFGDQFNGRFHTVGKGWFRTFTFFINVD